MTLTPAPEAPVRPPLVRPRAGRIVGGVAAGLAAHLELPVRVVRIALVLSCFLGGFGLILYVWLWALTPAGVSGAGESGPGASGVGSSGSAAAGPDAAGSAASGPDPSDPARAGTQAGLLHRIDRGRLVDIGIGLTLLIVGLTLLDGWLGWGLQPGVVLPLLVVTGGALLAYSQLDEVERSRWVARTGVGTRTAALRVVAGLLLVLLGILLVLVQRASVATAGVMLLSAVAVLGGAGLVLAPWGVRLWRDLDAERAARAREAERADIAAHLHDSVLQTLALIQRHNADPGAVSRLARAQERDLRDWLYGPRPNAHATLAAEVRRAAADIEDLHGVAVDVVLVGDQGVDERVAALVAALREAIVNAARHAGGPVQVYVEAGPDGIEAFVRDRGPGFDLAAVPADRRGVRESIIGRMERYGGSADLRSRAGEGTEVRLVLPVTRAPAGAQEAT